MARSIKGKKPVGYDYWSRRPTPDMSPGRSAKTMTHRRERIEARAIIKEQTEAELEQIAKDIKDKIQAYADHHGISFDEARKRAKITIQGKSFRIGEEDEQD